MNIVCRQATIEDVDVIRSILHEAAEWLYEMGEPLWRLDELSEESIQADVMSGYFRLFECEGTPVGTLKFQLRDDLFWPDVPSSESAFVHRIAIRRAFSGGKLSSLMMQWAVEEARRHGRRYLRLDCDAARPKLRAIYERFGFMHYDDRQIGPYFVSRYQLSVCDVGEIVIDQNPAV